MKEGEFRPTKDRRSAAGRVRPRVASLCLPRATRNGAINEEKPSNKHEDDNDGGFQFKSV